MPMISKRFFLERTILYTHRLSLVSIWIEIEAHMIQYGGAHDNFATLTVSTSNFSFSLN